MMIRKLTVAALAAALLALAALPAAAQAAFGIADIDVSLRDPDGQPLLQAGAHPDLITEFELNRNESKGPDDNLKDFELRLPPGLIGNPTLFDKCTQADLGRENFSLCGPESQIGLATVTFVNAGNEVTATVGLYNMETPPGVGGQFGFNIVNTLIFLDSGVSNDGEYTLTTRSIHASQGLGIVKVKVVIWGVPSDPAHDDERLPRGAQNFPPAIPTPGPLPVRPLMSNPTACTGTPLEFKVRANSWNDPDTDVKMSITTDSDGVPLVITGCDKVDFDADVEADVTTNRAAFPTGLDLAISMPYSEDPAEPATALLRDAEVTLPEGMTVNPAAAGGLQTCTEEQVNLNNEKPAECPEGSKIGTVRIETPLLEHELVGEVHQAEQQRNKFGSLLAIYFTFDDWASGTVLKLAGEVRPDPQTGRLTIVFPDNPQLPFTRLRVRMFDGPRASLKTPDACGIHTVTARFTGSTGATVTAQDAFETAAGPDGGPCPSGVFAPGFEAGTTDRAAGRHAPFVLRLTRADGMPALSTVTAALPDGLLAKLAGIPYCPDATLAAIPTAAGTGAAQAAAPSCPEASRVGTVAVSAGAGPNPYPVETGRAYLAGPYKGAPLSLAFVTPALAGPFDLGSTVVRAALHVDPATARVRAVSDPLPTILHGIPLGLREVRVSLDRPGFTLNPTSCAPKRIEALVGAAGGASAERGVPFQATFCRALGFRPRLALRLRGGTKRGQYPALTATLRMGGGEAAIRRASVALPRSEFLAQEHIRTVCTRVQWAADECPQAAIYGFAEAVTPLLDQPLRGPVYLRSSNNPLPDLVADLRGQIRIELVGRIDSHKRGIRTTFETVPDAPVTKFVLRMKGGKRSLLVNSRDICRRTHRATVEMDAHNGRGHDFQPALVPACRTKASRAPRAR